MRNNIIEISCNDRKKSLPDVAYNSVENTFSVVWAAAPGEACDTVDYYIAAQKISVSGELLGPPVEIVKTENIVLRPLVLHNPNKNQFLVIYGLGENYLNIWGVILDADGKSMGGHFKVTDVPANQVHYNMAFNSNRNQFFITYNDNRNGANDVYGLILDVAGAVAIKEFSVNNAPGHQVNPVVCYNPHNDTYLLNWEDFRAHGDSLPALGTLEVMTDIYGALLSADGAMLVNDIPMCADASGIDADQRFNGIAYNIKKNEFLVSWTDTRDSIHNVGIMGRIVKADGSMPAGDFILVDAPGAQMIGHPLYVPDANKYFIAFERDHNEVDKFYFKDITAHLEIAAQWLNADGRSEGDMIDIFSSEGNQRFVRSAYSAASNTFLLVWQSDFPGVSDSVEGHIMSAGGNILGKIYQR